MLEDLTPEQKTILSKLDRYWVKKSQLRPAALPSEHLLLQSSDHWIKYVFPTIVSIVLSAAGIGLLYRAVVSGDTSVISMLMFVLGLVLLVAVCHWYFWFLLAEYPVDIIVTNKRVIYMHSGLLWDEDLVEITFDKLKAVQAHKKTFLQSVLNYGSLDFEGKAVLRGVSHPGTVAKVVQQAMGMS